MSKPFSFLNFRLYIFLTFNVFFIFTFVCMVNSFLQTELLPSSLFSERASPACGSGLSLVAGFSCLASSITGWCVSLRGRCGEAHSWHWTVTCQTLQAVSFPKTHLNFSDHVVRLASVFQRPFKHVSNAWPGASPGFSAAATWPGPCCLASLWGTPDSWAAQPAFALFLPDRNGTSLFTGNLFSELEATAFIPKCVLSSDS